MKEDMKTIRQWAILSDVPYYTAVKRRRMADLGVLIPPKTWLLTREEWEIVKRTPLPGCSTVKK